MDDRNLRELEGRSVGGLDPERLKLLASYTVDDRRRSEPEAEHPHRRRDDAKGGRAPDDRVGSQARV